MFTQKKILIPLIFIVVSVIFGVFSGRDVGPVNYEQVAVDFIFANDFAFIEDGFNLQLVSKENLEEGVVKLVFNYNLFGYPEGDVFMVNVFVDSKGKAFFSLENNNEIIWNIGSDSFYSDFFEPLDEEDIKEIFGLSSSEEVNMSFNENEFQTLNIYSYNESTLQYIVTEYKSNLWKADIRDSGIEGAIKIGDSKSFVSKVIGIEVEDDIIYINNLEGGLEIELSFDVDLLDRIIFNNTFLH